MVYGIVVLHNRKIKTDIKTLKGGKPISKTSNFYMLVGNMK